MLGKMHLTLPEFSNGMDRAEQVYADKVVHDSNLCVCNCALLLGRYVEQEPQLADP